MLVRTIDKLNIHVYFFIFNIRIHIKGEEKK